jgi:hypothetical protein
MHCGFAHQERSLTQHQPHGQGKRWKEPEVHTGEAQLSWTGQCALTHGYSTPKQEQKVGGTRDVPGAPQRTSWLGVDWAGFLEEGSSQHWRRNVIR